MVAGTLRRGVVAGSLGYWRVAAWWCSGRRIEGRGWVIIVGVVVVVIVVVVAVIIGSWKAVGVSDVRGVLLLLLLLLHLLLHLLLLLLLFVAGCYTVSIGEIVVVIVIAATSARLRIDVGAVDHGIAVCVIIIIIIVVVVIIAGVNTGNLWRRWRRRSDEMRIAKPVSHVVQPIATLAHQHVVHHTEKVFGERLHKVKCRRWG